MMNAIDVVNIPSAVLREIEQVYDIRVEILDSNKSDARYTIRWFIRKCILQHAVAAETNNTTSEAMIHQTRELNAVISMIPLFTFT